MSPDEIRLVERAPTVDEYRRLRAVVGWNEVAPWAVAEGLGRALFSVCAVRNGEVVGCGRVVGDGGIYFYLQDIIVLPELQGRGLGARIMDAVMAFLADHAAPGSFVGLMAAQGVSGFYGRYGFAERPAGRPGMYRVWE